MKRNAVIFFLFFLLYSCSSRFNLDGYELEYVQSARNVLHGNGFALAPGFSGLPGIPDTTGQYPVFPRQNYLQVWLTIPFYAAGAFFFGEEPTLPNEGTYWKLPWGPMAFVALLNPIMAALTVILVILLCIELGLSVAAARLNGVLYGLATMAWPYAGLGMEVCQTFFLMLMVFFAVRFRNTQKYSSFFAALLSIILLPSCKKYSVMFIIPIIAYLIYVFIERSEKFPFQIVAVLTACALLGFAIPFVQWVHRMLQNPQYLHFLSEVLHYNRNAAPLSDVIYGLILSPGEGLFPFNPILIFAVPGWMAFRKHRAEAYMFLGIALILFLSIFRLPYILIEEEWGPRYFHPLIPLMIIAGASYLTQQRKGLKKMFFIFIVCISIFIQFLGTSFLGFKLLDSGMQLGTDDYTTLVFTPSLSQIALSWINLRSLIHRYRTGTSLNLEHRVYHDYSGRDAPYEIQSLNLQGFDQPAGGFFIVRWVLAAKGHHVWSEQLTFVLWTTTAFLLIISLFAAALI